MTLEKPKRRNTSLNNTLAAMVAVLTGTGIALNPIWTGVFANLKDWGAFCPPPPLTWLFQVRRR